MKMTRHVPFDFGYEQFKPEEPRDYLGRLVNFYGFIHTVVKVSEDASRLYIATNGRSGEWEGQWVQAHMIAAPGRTILNWNWRTDFREKPEECERLCTLAMENVARRKEEARKKEDAYAALCAERREGLKRIMPEWAKAAIVARLHEERSAPVSDYYDSRVVREVLLGFSKTERNSFAEMRKAAALFPPTACFAGPEGEEHRENYSMGRGYYLKKSGVSYHSGWEVRKMRISRDYPLALELEHWMSRA